VALKLYRGAEFVNYSNLESSFKVEIKGLRFLARFFLIARNLANLDWVYLLGRGMRAFKNPAVYVVFMLYGFMYI
jgi:hypothetical protein